MLGRAGMLRMDRCGLFVLALLVGAVLSAGSLFGQESGQETRTVDLHQALSAKLLNQAKAWNRGDIDAFMQAYWKSGTSPAAFKGMPTVW